MSPVRNRVRVTTSGDKIVWSSEWAKPRRKKARAGHRVTTVKADPIALATAKMLAEGDDARLEVQSDGSVIIRNRPRKGGERR